MYSRRGNIESRKVVRLVGVFIFAVFLQCCVLFLTIDFLQYYQISSYSFLFCSFTLTGIISTYQQKSWRYLTYLNSKRLFVLFFQSIFYVISYLFLFYGLNNNGVLQLRILFIFVFI